MAGATGASALPHPGRAAVRPPWFAVIGTGRCGTGYTAAVLSACGLRCGHEHWWTPQASRRAEGLDGDASWMALPDIEMGVWSGPAVHVIRHPVDVVASLVGIGFFTRRTPYRDFALRYEPELLGLAAVEAAARWWQRWNDRCAAVADLTVPIERLLDHHLARVAEVVGDRFDPKEVATVSTTVNHRRRAWIDPLKVWRHIERGYGYEEDDRG